MEKIEILGPDGFEPMEELDKAIKEQIKVNERKQRRNGNVQKHKRKAGKLASDEPGRE